MRKRRMVWAVLLLIGVLPIVGLAWLSWSAQRPANLGVTDGRLAECPETPNCVCSQADDESQQIAPLPLSAISGDSAAGDTDDVAIARRAIQRLAKVVGGFSQANVVRQTDDYLHAEFTSRLFRFVDDVEFFVDVSAGVVHCRSASRVGRSDLGANRRRLEAIRDALAAAAEES